MKKALALILALVMILSFAACGEKKENASEDVKKSTYPEGPITLVVPYGAGGGTDLFARVVAEKMTQTIGKPVEVTNVTGGSGTNGAQNVIDNGPDGYKLGFGITTPLTIMPLYGQTAYTKEDVQPICTAYETIQGIAVAADSEIQTIDDLIAFINKNNGSLSYGGSGTGNMQHMTIEEWFRQVSPDWKMTLVPYTDGDAAEAVALMAHEVPFAIVQAQGVKSYIEDGSLRFLMIFSDELPQWIQDDKIDVPTVKDKGYKFSLSGTIGIWGPKGISDEVVAAVDKAFKEAVADEKVLEAIKNLGLEVKYGDSKKYQQIIDEQIPVAEQLLKELGLI